MRPPSARRNDAPRNRSCQPRGQSVEVRTDDRGIRKGEIAFIVPLLVVVLVASVVEAQGLIFPIENMPRAIQLVTYAIPLRDYADVIRAVFLRGSRLEVLWPEALTLAAMGLAIFAVASAALPQAGRLRPSLPPGRDIAQREVASNGSPRIPC